MGKNEVGPTKQNPIAMKTLPRDEQSLGFKNLSTIKPQNGAASA